MVTYNRSIKDADKKYMICASWSNEEWNSKLLKQIRILKLRAYLQNHPREDTSTVASRFGFSDRKYLYKFIKGLKV